MIPKSFREAQKLYDLSVKVSQSWISKYYPRDNHQILGIPLEKVQAFSQHHFFSCLLEGKPIDDIWSQYPRTTDRPSKAHFFQRTLQLVRNLTAPKVNIGHLDPDTQIVFLSSGRHLEDWQSAIFYLRRQFKILVVGKIPNEIQKRFAKQKVPAINLSSGRRFLTRQKRFLDLLFFLKFFWKKQGKHHLFDQPLWQKRLWYLRLEQFPEISALLKFANEIFKKTKPALLLTTSSNDTFGASFALTAQHLKIPVAELQHGYTNVATDIPFYNSDYQLVWGKIPQKIRKSYAKRAIVIGCPFLKKLNKNNEEQSTARTIRILVLWTPPFGTIALFKSQANKKTLADLIAGLSHLPKNFLVTLRSHPSNPFEPDLNKSQLPDNLSISNENTPWEAVAKHDLVIAQPTTATFMAVLQNKPLIFFNNSWLTQHFGEPMVKNGSTLNVPLGKLKRIDEYVLRLINNRKLLTRQQIAQEKFVNDYCSYFGNKSCEQIAEFAKKIINEKSSGN